MFNIEFQCNCPDWPIITQSDIGLFGDIRSIAKMGDLFLLDKYNNPQVYATTTTTATPAAFLPVVNCPECNAEKTAIVDRAGHVCRPARLW